MLNTDRRTGHDRRSTDSFNKTAPFLTKEGLVFTDRRRGDRRQDAAEEVVDLGEVEEIVLEPVRF